ARRARGAQDAAQLERGQLPALQERVSRAAGHPAREPGEPRRIARGARAMVLHDGVDRGRGAPALAARRRARRGAARVAAVTTVGAVGAVATVDAVQTADAARSAAA